MDDGDSMASDDSLNEAFSPGNFSDEESVQEGSDDYPEVHGFTPLHWAAQLNDARKARSLLKEGASVDAADEDGNTPLYVAVNNVYGPALLVVTALLEVPTQMRLTRVLKRRCTVL